MSLKEGFVVEGTTEFRKELVVGCLVGNKGMSFEHGKTTGS